MEMPCMRGMARQGPERGKEHPESRAGKARIAETRNVGPGGPGRKRLRRLRETSERKQRSRNQESPGGVKSFL